MNSIDDGGYDILGVLLKYIRFDGLPDAYVRFLTQEDGGGMGEEHLASLEAFRKYYDKKFEFWRPPVGKEHHKSAVWKAAAKVMSYLLKGKKADYREYLNDLFDLKKCNESNLKFNPICRSKQDVWTDEMNKYTGLKQKEYEHLCWLARPRILFEKLQEPELGDPADRFYIILYAEWNWMQVLDRIFPDVDYLKTHIGKTGLKKGSPTAYRYYFDRNDRIVFAYLNINYLGDARMEEFCEGLLKKRPDLKDRILKASPGENHSWE